MRDLTAPFGGFRISGIGREGGDYALDFHSDLKTVQVNQGRLVRKRSAAWVEEIFEIPKQGYGICRWGFVCYEHMFESDGIPKGLAEMPPGRS